MKKTILKYGLGSGFLISVFMIISLYLYSAGSEFTSNMYYGFTTMLVALSLIFFALSNYRKQEPSKYNYLNGLLLGLGISLICATMYVLTWEVAFNSIAPDFMDKYAKCYIDGLQSKGMTADQIAIETAKMKEQVIMYNNQTWYRMGVTFTEIFPMGLLVSLVAPLFIRKKN